MTRDYFDSHGKPIFGYDAVPPEAAPALDPAVAAELDAVAVEGKRIADRFQELVPDDYWQDIKVVRMHVASANPFERNGDMKSANAYRAIARAVSEHVDEARAAIYAQIRQEMDGDDR